MARKKSVKRRPKSLEKRKVAGNRLLKNNGHGNERAKHRDERNWRDDKGRVPVTPQMIRLAVKELHARKVYVSSSLIANHLRRYYPIESDPEALREELNEKLEDAVRVGLVTKCGPDAYCLPTLRQQATSRKTDFTRFWERYNKRGSRNRKVNCLENPRRKNG